MTTGGVLHLRRRACGGAAQPAIKGHRVTETVGTFGGYKR